MQVSPNLTGAELSQSPLPRATSGDVSRHLHEAFVTHVAGFANLNAVQENDVALNATRTVDRTTSYAFLPNRHSSGYRSLRERLMPAIITQESRCTFLLETHKDVQA
jgi:hypothetical protein